MKVHKKSPSGEGVCRASSAASYNQPAARAAFLTELYKNMTEYATRPVTYLPSILMFANI